MKQSSFKKPAANVPQEAIVRRCLMCRDRFESAWHGERICKRCKSTAAWREG
ncbi:hypothetical protein [Pelagibius sp.]|uniref:hypothetical protein n=1 Tax=Pelagibius sp. TaxID=1931238 RepID=UPI003B50F5EE